MTMVEHINLYKAEDSNQLLIEPLDAITLIYHRRSGITHMVAEPVPEILAALGGDAVTAATVVERLAAVFDLAITDDAIATVAARLEELADLGLIERVTSGA
jgi:PqqD family protein of HPr-rel-A system